MNREDLSNVAACRYLHNSDLDALGEEVEGLLAQGWEMPGRIYAVKQPVGQQSYVFHAVLIRRMPGEDAERFRKA